MKKNKSEEHMETEEQAPSLSNEASDSAPAGEFCPILRALQMVGARWTLVLVRHLLSGPKGFQELRERAGIGPRVLSTRLNELIERGLVEKVAVGNRSHYALTEFGQTLEPVVREIALWWVRHAMAQSGPLNTTPASALEAVSFLLRRDRGSEDFTCDLRLTVRESGGWTVEVSDAPLAPASKRTDGRDAAHALAGGSVHWFTG